MRELESNFQKYTGRVVLRGDVVKGDCGAYAVFTEQGSSASQVTAAKIMDVIARLPDLTDQQLTQYQPKPKYNWRTLPDCSKFQSQNIQTYGLRLPTTSMAEILGNHWRSCGTSWTKCVRPPTCWSLTGNTIRGSSIGTWTEKSTKLGISVCSSKTRIILSVNVDDVFTAGKKQNRVPMWKKWMKNVDLEEPTSFLDHVFWDALNVNVNRTRSSLNNRRRCLDHAFLLEQLKSYQDGKNLTQKQLHGPPTWKDMLESALNDVANWQTRKWSSYFKVSSPCLDDHQFRQEALEAVGEVSKVCSQIVLKCLYLAWMGDQTFCGLSTSLRD